MVRPQCGQVGIVPRACSATALTLCCSAANICGRYSISTSRSNSRKREGPSAKTGRAGGISGSGAGCGRGMAGGLGGRRGCGSRRPLATLLASEHQQFCVDRQQFGRDAFELSSGLDTWTNGVEPVGRNGLDALFAGGHEGEGGERMTITFGTVAGRFSAAAMGNRERAWEGSLGEMKASQQKAGATAEAGSFRAVSERRVHAHLIVILQSDNNKNNTLQKCS